MVRDLSSPTFPLLRDARLTNAYVFRELRFVDATTVNVLNCTLNAWLSAEKFLLQKGEVSCRCPFALSGAPERWTLVFRTPLRLASPLSGHRDRPVIRRDPPPVLSFLTLPHLSFRLPR